jgi:DNA-binding transcriptional regulator YiaG
MTILGPTLRAELKEAIGLRSVLDEIRSLRREVGEVRALLDSARPRAARAPSDPVPPKPMITGAEVRALRDSLGDTRKAFAARVKVSPSIVFMWESGRSRPSRSAVVSRLQQLMVAGGGAEPRRSKSPGTPVGDSPDAAPRRTVRVSASRRAALKVQGQYMGALRALQPRQKAQVKSVRASKGFPAAIKLAKRLAR